MYRRYLTKICDQDSDAESVDMEAYDSDRFFTFQVAETDEQEPEEKAVA